MGTPMDILHETLIKREKEIESLRLQISELSALVEKYRGAMEGAINTQNCGCKEEKHYSDCYLKTLSEALSLPAPEALRQIRLEVVEEFMEKVETYFADGWDEKLPELCDVMDYVKNKMFLAEFEKEGV